MALFEIKDLDKKIWEEELKDFLPEKILDVHTHVYKREFYEKPKANEVKRTVSWPNTVASENPIEDLQETYELMFPGKDVKALMFIGGGGRDKNNESLSFSTFYFIPQSGS